MPPPGSPASDRGADDRNAVLAVVVVVFLWSVANLFVRAGETNALVFTTWRLWIALPPLAVFVAAQARRHGSAALWPDRVPRRTWAVSMLGAGALFVASVATTFSAIRMTTLLDVTLISLLQPVIVVVFAVAFLHERVRASNIARAAVAIAGTVLVAAAATNSGTWSLAGDLVAVVALLLNSAWFLYGRVLRMRVAVDPVAFMFGTLVAGTLVLTPVAVVAEGSLAISGRGLFFAACVAVSGSTAHILMLWAHRFVPTSVSAPLMLAELPIVAVGAWVWFGESINALQVVGSVVVVVALWGVFRSPVVERIEDEIPDPEPPM